MLYEFCFLGKVKVVSVQPFNVQQLSELTWIPDRQIDHAQKYVLKASLHTSRSNKLSPGFRMKYAHSAWKEERLSWRAVIQLNVIRSVVTIVEIVQNEMTGQNPAIILTGGDDDTEREDTDDGPPVVFSEKHRLLKLRLGPLRRVEEDLKRRLGAGCEEIQPTNAPMRATPFDPDSTPELSPIRRVTAGEFVVRCWKDAFQAPSSPTSSNRALGKERADHDEATEVIARCKDDMKALWDDDIVQGVLRRRKIRLQDSAGL